MTVCLSSNGDCIKRVSSPVTLLGLALWAFVPAGASAEPPLREGHLRDDFVVREAMVPMRDGVKLFTLILLPKSAPGALPILLERTPHDGSRAVEGRATTHITALRGTKWLVGA